MARGRVVLILGMHRSGTSLLARVLAALGLPLGRNLLTDAAPDNAHGYWEQREIVAIQEALLAQLNRRWFGRHGLEPLPPGWEGTPPARAAQARLRAILAEEMAAAGPLWGFKDPRTLRFLPMWRAILEEAELEPVPILAARHPAAVAASLVHRNRLDARRSEALWAFNTLEALRGAAGHLASVIDYDAWFGQPEAQARHLRERLGLPGAPEAASRLVEPALRHHPAAFPAIHAAFADLHAALIARAPLPPDPHAIAGAMRAAEQALTEHRRRPGGLRGLLPPLARAPA